MTEVKFVERVQSVEVTDGYWFVRFAFDREKGKLKTVFRGCHKGRMHEPVYVPKAIYADFVKRAYAVFYDSKKKKVKLTYVPNNQLELKF